MTMVVTTPRRVKPARPFAEGLAEPEPVALEIRGRYYVTTSLPTVEGVAVVRVSAMDDAGAVYDVRRGPDGLVACQCGDYVYRHAGTPTMCKHGLAVVEAGLLEAPAPVIADGGREADVIPSSVVKVRVTSGPSEGIWVRPTDHLAGCRWRAEDDVTGRWVASAVMSDWYLAGRVAILADRPATTPKGEVSTHTPTTLDSSEGIGGIDTLASTPEPTPADEGDVEGSPDSWPAWTDSDRWELSDLPIESSPSPAPLASADKPAATPQLGAAKGTTRRGPSAEDRAYWNARTIGLEAERYVPPPSHLPADLVPAWEAGMAEAEAVGMARELAYLEVLERQASVDHAEWAEARMALPPAVAMD